MSQTTKEQGEQVREEILTSIIEYIKQYGYPPSVREIGDLAGLKSPSSVKNHLDRMIRAGILETSHESSPRAIRIPGYRFIREEKETMAPEESEREPETVQYCYSWDGEEYYSSLYKTEKEALQDARAEKQAYRYDEKEVYIAQAVIPNLCWNSNEEYILVSMIEDLIERCGENGEDGLEVTEEQEAALGKMIDQAVWEWIIRYKIKPTCYAVRNPEIWEV